MPGKKPTRRRPSSKGVAVSVTPEQLAELKRLFRGTEIATVVPKQAMGIYKTAVVRRKPPPGVPPKKRK